MWSLEANCQVHIFIPVSEVIHFPHWTVIDERKGEKIRSRERKTFTWRYMDFQQRQKAERKTM